MLDFDFMLIHLVECICARNKLLPRIISKLNVLYVVDVDFRDFIVSFRNIGGAQDIVARNIFQEELFNLEQSGMALLRLNSQI